MARAQIEAGRVVDDSTHAPLVHVPVVLERSVEGKWTQLKADTTDHEGTFQFVLSQPGIYRVGFAGEFMPLFYGAVDTLAADSMQQRESGLPILRTRGTRAYYGFEVDRRATLPQGSPAPDYPPPNSGLLGGTAVVRCVIGADGRPDTTTFAVLATTDTGYAEAVRRYLARIRFVPATLGGSAVPQMIQQAFSYKAHTLMRYEW